MLRIKIKAMLGIRISLRIVVKVMLKTKVTVMLRIKVMTMIEISQCHSKNHGQDLAKNQDNNARYLVVRALSPLKLRAWASLSSLPVVMFFPLHSRQTWVSST